MSDESGQASLGSMLVKVGTPETAGEPASESGKPADESGKPAGDGGTSTSGPARPPLSAPAAAATPSWGRVLATTIRLWLRRRWPLAATVVLAAAVAVTALAVSGTFSSAGGSVTRPRPATASPSLRATAPAVPTPQTEAAAWIADQVSGDAIIACDPAACAALQAQGVSAGRLMPLQAATPDPKGATLVVTSATSAAVAQYAPAVVASFGTGSAQIDVRAAEPGGAAAYRSALSSDLAARVSAGTQLLKNKRITFTAQDAVQLQAGQVDARVLATLATLASQGSITVAAFGDAAPGAAILYREVLVTTSSASELAADLALVKAQVQPYLPAQAEIVPAGAGQGVLTIEFSAPSPLGLLTAVLDVAHLAR